MKRTITFAAAALLLAAGASRAAVQAQELRPVDMKGTIEGLNQGILSLKCEDKPVYLKIDPRTTRVECNGTAEVSYLRPGVMIRFRGEFDKRGTAKEDIDKLSIITTSDVLQPGVTSDEIGGDDEKPRKKQKPKEDEEGASMQVIGQIKQIKDGLMQVQAGSRTVRAKIAEDAKIDVDVDDYTMAEAGDEIQFKGRMVPPQGPDMPSQVFGDEVTITFAKPLVGDVKGKPKSRPAKGSGKKKPESRRTTARKPLN